MTKISPKNIAEAIYQATVGKSGNDLTLVLKRGAKMLKDKRLLPKSEDVLSFLQNILDEKSGTVRMKVVTAKEISSGDKKKLENEIKEKYKAEKVLSEFFEKRNLLGGMRIEIGDEVLDTTYKSKLSQLEKFLIQGK
ncbi:MAG: F0F1 ATP synthase subunit delta [Patescibacteria group bacterium]